MVLAQLDLQQASHNRSIPVYFLHLPDSTSSLLFIIVAISLLRIGCIRSETLQFYISQIAAMAGVSNSFKLVIALAMIIAGAFDTLVYKTQNKQLVQEGQVQKYFFHPFMQVAAMFLGEILALGFYFLHKAQNPQGYARRASEAQAEGKLLHFNKLKFAIPALCDVMASNLQLFALNFIAGSVYQMMRGGTIITTFIFSLLILKIKAKPFQIVGSALAFIGIAVVGVAAMVFGGSEETETEVPLQIAGYVMLVISLFLNGFQFTYEQTLFNRYHIQPLMLVGCEGIVGFTVECIVITILNFVHCSFGADACAYNASGTPLMESTSAYFASVGASGFLLAFVVLGVFSIMIFNVSGVTVTKYISALTRSICDVTRTLLIWVVGIVVTVTAGRTKDNYVWQSTKLTQILTESGGFVILIVGNLVYNNILKLPCLEEETDLETASLVKSSDEKYSSQHHDGVWIE